MIASLVERNCLSEEKEPLRREIASQKRKSLSEEK